MKTDAITRAYAGLSNRERAALAFKYLCDGNELELTRVADSAPRGTFTYTGAHFEYGQRFDRLFAVASWWAVEHWKAFARYASAYGAVLEACHNRDRAGVDRFLRETEAWESRLIALETALDAIGPEQGLDPEAVRKLAGCGRFDPLFLDGPEAAHLESAKAELSGLLSGRAPATKDRNDGRIV